MATPVVESLFITLKRGMAGVRHQHVRIVKAIGLTYRQQTVERTNTPAMRGAVAKIPHLLTLETNLQRAARLAAQAEARKLRPPVIVKHA
ncbi:50S ribosomal protein L30 [Auxenochlorella protothecoides]|uniref:Large ribosomal subunit protein uL30m n=1 Tax=Auxenochlorella protothecoides TaxID=3075 RepID=A0A087SP97_AUXPR|nr:50S ribosomal protein L30 [Auxenochlorella protothecoides]KFM27551.1 50S ribosomal protein L30 [Auxenochlorella protothecoides]